MNRILKFRIYDEKYGMLSHDQIDFNEVLANDVFDVMQYTGVNDTFDIELYEGDIVKFFHKTCNYTEPLVGKVFYNVTQWYIGYHNEYGKEKMVKLNKTRFTEIIGNIYETPEILFSK